MMTALKEWLTAVAAVAVLLYLVRCLLPQSAVRRAADFTWGLVLLAALVQPLLALAPGDLAISPEQWQRQIAQRQEELEQTQQAELSAVIAERTASYISHKADALGLDVSVTAQTAAGGDGLAVPWSVTVEGPYSEALATLIAQDLGIPRERQDWHEREN